LLTYFLGTAQKSYGIEVATLAGLPSQVWNEKWIVSFIDTHSQVINRAYELTRLSEANSE
jgi:DNA mismatch repair ATPase MutS